MRQSPSGARVGGYSLSLPLTQDFSQVRRRAASRPDDLLSLLLAARDGGTGVAMTDEQLKDEALTLLTAGHETAGAAGFMTLPDGSILDLKVKLGKSPFDDLRAWLGWK
jgi:hypothetical protein